ncbi:MAG: Fe-S cluster assembly ATPase SufC [Bacilli bacterium]|nr:Fe-S cluster assembly ATPase SufC [Bacilli bacterium]
MSTLRIKNLHAEVEGKEILKGINLEINNNETVAILGPNGHGKSTLFNVIMGHPRYKVTKGSIFFDDVDVLALSTDQRSKLGLFLGLQNPSEVPGVINSDFLRAAVNAHNDNPISTYNFYKVLDNAVKEVQMPFDLATRSLNEGFSGGEKKRNEILQMLLLEPKISMLDEIDSGLDVDAIQIVADVIKKQQQKGQGFLIISHYARLFDLIQPTRAIVIINGKVVLDGGKDIIQRIDKTGYEFIKTELGIEIQKEEAKMNTVSIGSCAVKEAIKK